MREESSFSLLRAKTLTGQEQRNRKEEFVLKKGENWQVNICLPLLLVVVMKTKLPLIPLSLSIWKGGRERGMEVEVGACRALISQKRRWMGGVCFLFSRQGEESLAI